MDGNRFFNHHVVSVKFYFMKIFLFCLFLIGNLPAQTPNIQEAGKCSVTLVNALPGPANLHVKFGSEDIWPPGFTPGQSTGAVLFPFGRKAVELNCEGFATTKEEIAFPARSNVAMVFFPGEEVKDGPDKGKKKIAVFCPPPILPGHPPQGKNWNVLLVGPLSQARLSLNSKMLDLKLGQPTTLNAGRGGISLENGNKLLLAVSPEEDGNYWVVVFGDNPDSLQAVILNHIAYTVPK